MALPASDPYRLADPSFATWDIGSFSYNGRDYELELTGNNFTIFSHFYSVQDSDSDEKHSKFYHFGFTGTAGTMLKKSTVYMGDDGDSYFPGNNQHFWVVNPLTYVQEYPSDIMLGVAHWYCDIAEADIDVTSFTAVTAWCTANSILRSVSFYGVSVIKVLKELCEQSYQVFLYVNGQQQLACGYMEHEPSDTPDWIIGANEYIRIIRFGEIRDRSIPGVVKYGWDPLEMNPQDPKFGAWKIDTSGIFTDKDLVLDSEYDCKWVDNGHDDSGSYIAWDDFVLLEIEVGGIGFCIDIDEVVQVNEPLLALGIDAAYPENFRVHKVVLNPTNMTARLTLIKKKSWNI